MLLYLPEREVQKKMSKIVNIRGYNSENGIGRRENIFAKNSEDFIIMKNTPININMIAHTIYQDFDSTRRGRPFLVLNGMVTSVQIPEAAKYLDDHVPTVSFTEKDSSQIEVRWELSNDEISKLAPKGLFGFDHEFNYNAPESINRWMNIPKEFYSETQPWQELPTRGNVVMYIDEKDGKRVPLITVEVPTQMYTDSVTAGYGDLSQYFENPTYLASPSVVERKVITEEIVNDADNELENKDALLSQRPDYTLTPSEEEEAKKRANMMGNVRSAVNEEILAEKMEEKLKKEKQDKKEKEHQLEQQKIKQEDMSKNSALYEVERTIKTVEQSNDRKDIGHEYAN